MVRLILILVIIILIARTFVLYTGGSNAEKKQPGEVNKDKSKKGVPKEVGEYVDYEEIKK
jgi:hypothetical protein